VAKYKCVGCLNTGFYYLPGDLLALKQKYLDELDYSNDYTLNICRIAGGGYIYPKAKIIVQLISQISYWTSVRSRLAELVVLVPMT
jgi:hypothetical protein